MPDPTVHRSDNGRKRALFISSPIGLGHAQRDVAIAKELRALVPDLQIDWLAQDPVTRVLESEGERIHPASRAPRQRVRALRVGVGRARPAVFQASAGWTRSSSPTSCSSTTSSNEEQYDLWIADEGWEIDYFLHEHPELKKAHYAWLTDFVGFLPMPDGGDREAFLTADYNAEMVEHIDALPAGPRPRDLRRQPRGHRRRAARPRPADDPRLDRGRISTSRATSPASTPPTSATARRCAPSSATATTRRSASSRWVAPGSARASCAA